MSGCGCSGSCSSEGLFPVDTPASEGRQTRFLVDGLCCESESALVRKHLYAIDGITEVQVHLVSREVVVSHTDDTSAETISSALNAAGFATQATDAQRSADAPPSHDGPAHALPWLLITTGLLFAAALVSLWWAPARWAGALAAVIGVAPISRRAWAALQVRMLDMNVLMTVAIVGALAIGEWTEAAAVVFLFGVSDWLEARALDRARDAIGEVMRLAPNVAVLESGEHVSAESVAVGTRVAVRAGEHVPLDGVVVEGSASIDESALTGESRPMHKKADDEVSAGTLNMRGYLVVETTAVAADSTVARMAGLIAEARSARAPLERAVDRFARVYTPAVFAMAVMLGVAVPLVVGSWDVWFYRALVLLVIACPCALVVSTPVAVVSGLARAARDGILVKGGAHLEMLGRVQTVAFDKTGTLTEGRFGVVDCVALNGYSTEEMHRWLARAEHRSSHPLAAALLEHAPLAEGSSVKTSGTYETIEGEGIEMHDGDVSIYVGNHRLAQRMGWHDDEEHAYFQRWKDEGKTVVYLGVDGKLAGMHALADVVRPRAQEAMARLRRLGTRLVMLTGDNEGAAQVVGDRVGGFDTVESELLPADKVARVEALRALGHVAMVGDGINDGPALAASDVGIAMGVRGTAVAMETADVGLMTDDLSKVASAIALGRRVLGTIHANVAFAIGVKALVIVLAALGLATLWMAVVADVGATLSVVLYSLLLLRPVRSDAGQAEGNQTPALADG